MFTYEGNHLAPRLGRQTSKRKERRRAHAGLNMAYAFDAESSDEGEEEFEQQNLSLANYHHNTPFCGILQPENAAQLSVFVSCCEGSYLAKYPRRGSSCASSSGARKGHHQDPQPEEGDPLVRSHASWSEKVDRRLRDVMQRVLLDGAADSDGSSQLVDFVGALEAVLLHVLRVGELPSASDVPGDLNRVLLQPLRWTPAGRSKGGDTGGESDADFCHDATANSAVAPNGGVADAVSAQPRPRSRCTSGGSLHVSFTPAGTGTGNGPLLRMILHALCQYHGLAAVVSTSYI